MMNALAASASLVFAASAAVKTTSCCTSAGNGPTRSKPGAVRTLTRNTPSSESPLTTALTNSAGAACDFILAFIASLMPTLKYPQNLVTSSTLRYGGNGLRFKQRLLQRVGG